MLSVVEANMEEHRGLESLFELEMGFVFGLGCVKQCSMSISGVQVVLVPTRALDVGALDLIR